MGGMRKIAAILVADIVGYRRWTQIIRRAPAIDFQPPPIG
jgi:hypothetical protein